MACSPRWPRAPRRPRRGRRCGPRMAARIQAGAGRWSDTRTSRSVVQQPPHHRAADGAGASRHEHPPGHRAPTAARARRGRGSPPPALGGRAPRATCGVALASSHSAVKNAMPQSGLAIPWSPMPSYSGVYQKPRSPSASRIAASCSGERCPTQVGVRQRVLAVGGEQEAPARAQHAAHLVEPVERRRLREVAPDRDRVDEVERLVAVGQPRGLRAVLEADAGQVRSAPRPPRPGWGRSRATRARGGRRTAPARCGRTSSRSRVPPGRARARSRSRPGRRPRGRRSSRSRRRRARRGPWWPPPARAWRRTGRCARALPPPRGAAARASVTRLRSAESAASRSSRSAGSSRASSAARSSAVSALVEQVADRRRVQQVGRQRARERGGARPGRAGASGSGAPIRRARSARR